MTSITEKVISKTFISWKALLALSMLAAGVIGMESCTANALRSEAVVAEAVSCDVVAVHDTGKVDLNCGGSRNSFQDSSMAISLLKKPQPLVCTLHQDKDSADCALPGAKKS